MEYAHDAPHVGAPDHELKNSPIYDDSDNAKKHHEPHCTTETRCPLPALR